MPIQERNASARDYSMAAIPSSNPLSVSLQTLSAENACHDWKPAETAFRCDSTRQGVERRTGPLKRLSAAITRANHSIASAYQSNCINGYRQRSHDVIDQGDSSNVLGHQVSLQLQNTCTKSPSQSAASVHLYYGTKSVCSFSTNVL